ncbi:MAG: LLM class flavin-dependent oxidoreductase, partial [Alphaproteobacteria bacterium]|nr:LLM class flavin-dependent oxidoreductase [Alphaproteobacteria bacterium]
DLISKGRAGWNVVASWSEHEAQNFGLQTTLDYDTRYARSAEFVDVVKGLWDGWDDGALLLDKAGGRYFDEAKMHVLDHQGRFFKVRWPLTVTCMPQGHPVIVQAGASEQGRELGAATADVIYAISGSCEAARTYYDDVKGRMAKYGREPDDLKIMPAFCPVVAGTRAEAQAKFDQLQELVDPLAGLGSLYSTFGDLSGSSLDAPVPDDAIGQLEIRSISAQLRERVRREKPRIRELYLRSGITGSARSVRPPTSPTPCRNGSRTVLVTVLTLHRRICPEGARTLWSWSYPNCRDAGCSAPNMRARHCATIWGSNAPPAATLPRVPIGSWTPRNRLGDCQERWNLNPEHRPEPLRRRTRLIEQCVEDVRYEHFNPLRVHRVDGRHARGRGFVQRSL